jgi:predicted DNA-binding protein YlxM (UPF0122 family)
MPTYRVIKNPELGELDFYGNAGVMAQFEDENNTSLQEIADKKKVSFSQMYSLAFWAHYIACKRLKKEVKATREDLELYLTGKELANLFYDLVIDIVADLGIEQKEEAKQKKT